MNCVFRISFTSFFVVFAAASATVAQPGGTVSGELAKWHRVSITFAGPRTSETADPNPIRDYRLNVVFRNGDAEFTVPGFYAADGNAGETGAEGGNKWRVHFAPPAEGTWQYTASFRAGVDVAISDDPQAGEPAAFDGASGSFEVGPTNKSERDHRGKGMLRYVGEHYLRFAETGEYFLKGGADSPENFLAYREFDGTAQPDDVGRETEGEARRARLHSYEPHVQDYREGDPTWRGGRGKGIIGALNYLAGEGVNSVYFLTMNVEGDGNDVWPWTTRDERYRFDCSKLDQWELVFSHMDAMGIMLHVITQETENDQLLDGGELGDERKLYYRELIARFAHHPAVTWNLGEENTNTDEQRKAFARFIHELDPYDHPVVIHTYPGQYDDVYNPLLGYEHLQGPSLQTNDTHEQTTRWRERSSAAGHPWVVNLDEIGPANTGVKPDADDPTHDEVRKRHLWGNLMGGGGGVEWYFGYNFAHNDLNCEDFRSRQNMWDQTRIALEFFREHLPFERMQSADSLTASRDDYCFALPGEVYAVYLPDGGSTDLDLGNATEAFDVRWYNAREGGDLWTGSVESIQGPGRQSIGDPPRDENADWAALVRRRNS